MGKIKFRLAKPSDAKEVATLHYNVRDTYSVGYFAQMGLPFLKAYYKVVLNDPYEVVVCAEEDGKLCGFCSASLDINKQMERMNKKKFSLLFPALSSFIAKPSLIKATIKRWKVSQHKDDEKLIPKEGARCEYWMWDASNKNSAYSVALWNTYLQILYNLGVKKFPLDVDDVNEKVMKFHLLNKAVATEHITLSDGRERTLLEYDLEKRFQKK